MLPHFGVSCFLWCTYRFHIGLLQDNHLGNILHFRPRHILRRIRLIIFRSIVKRIRFPYQYRLRNYYRLFNFVSRWRLLSLLLDHIVFTSVIRANTSRVWGGCSTWGATSLAFNPCDAFFQGNRWLVVVMVSTALNHTLNIDLCTRLLPWAFHRFSRLNSHLTHRCCQLLLLMTGYDLSYLDFWLLFWTCFDSVGSCLNRLLLFMMMIRLDDIWWLFSHRDSIFWLSHWNRWIDIIPLKLMALNLRLWSLVARMAVVFIDYDLWSQILLLHEF